MAMISLRVPENELNLFKQYAKINNQSLSEVIRITMIERIEDEFDLRAIEEYEKKQAEGTLETGPIEELWEELGI